MIPVVFAINNNYVKQLSTVIISILKNTKSDIEFNVLETDISDENKNILSGITKNINFIDMKKVIENSKHNGRGGGGEDFEKYMSRRQNYKYVSIETYFRFFIPEIFTKYDKVLYLDADILVLGDISKLYNEDISNEYAGVVYDLWIHFSLQEGQHLFEQPKTFSDYFQNTLKLKNSPFKYFNAGVLLFNVAKMRQDNIVESLWSYTKENSPLYFQDQDVLNVILEGHVKFLDIKWNVLKDINIFDNILRDPALKKAVRSVKPAIVHYVGENKPWLYKDFHYYKYPYIKQWWNYYRKSPFFEKNQYYIYKSIRYDRYYEYLIVKLCGFNIFTIIYAENKLNYVFLHFGKGYIRFKKPKYYFARSINDNN
jgi:lipopolysaccharide biosynthesis glycosyltransferase